VFLTSPTWRSLPCPGGIPIQCPDSLVFLPLHCSYVLVHVGSRSRSHLFCYHHTCYYIRRSSLRCFTTTTFAFAFWSRSPTLFYTTFGRYIPFVVLRTHTTHSHTLRCVPGRLDVRFAFVLVSFAQLRSFTFGRSFAHWVFVGVHQFHATIVAFLGFFRFWFHSYGTTVLHSAFSPVHGHCGSAGSTLDTRSRFRFTFRFRVWFTYTGSVCHWILSLFSRSTLDGYWLFTGRFLSRISHLDVLPRSFVCSNCAFRCSPAVYWTFGFVHHAGHGSNGCSLRTLHACVPLLRSYLRLRFTFTTFTTHEPTVLFLRYVYLFDVSVGDVFVHHVLRLPFLHAFLEVLLRLFPTARSPAFFADSVFFWVTAVCLHTVVTP